MREREVDKVIWIWHYSRRSEAFQVFDPYVNEHMTLLFVILYAVHKVGKCESLTVM